MRCPYCSSENTKVIDKRETRRRRECESCGKRFTTYEHIESKHKTPSQVRKRDGRLVLFDQNRITNAIYAAAKSVGGKDRATAQKLSDQVVEIVRQRFKDKIPTVEEIQDIVEKILIEKGHAKTAKSYILYREKHKTVREMETSFIDVQNTISEYLNRGDWRIRENSNEDYSFSGLLLHTAGKVIATYALNHIYTPAIRQAYIDGHIHVHDLQNGFIGYCAGWSLKNLLVKGFGGVPNKAASRPAKHMNVVVHHMINYIGCLQMEFAGAQAFSSVDTLLAPFVKTDKLNYKQVKQCMQELIYSLNVPSRWGSQYPFSNLTFDWVTPNDMKDDKAIVGGKEQDFTYSDCQEEADMINKAFLEVMRDGDAEGSIFTFPIPTYNLTKDFDWDSENAHLLFEVTAKFGTPYFQNYVGSGLDPKSIRAMCCRLNLNMQELTRRPGHIFGAGDNTGSLGVVTMNMNRIGYEAKTKEEFFEKLGYYMTIAKDSLEIKRKVVEKNLKNGLMPYTQSFLGTFNNHFSTIGLCGMNECCLNFLGKSIATEEGKEFTIETLEFMREKLKEFQKETGNLYNLEATPAESTAYRFGRLDKKYHPDIITSGDKEPFLTNSTQLPVDLTDDAIEAIELQNDIQPLYTGGTIFHTFMGEKLSSGEACKKLVKRIAFNTKIPYFTITPTFSICKSHGYIIGEKPKCPKCGEETQIYSRVVGYFRPVRNWNDGKREEFRHRLEFNEQRTAKHEFRNEVRDIKQLSKERLLTEIA